MANETVIWSIYGQIEKAVADSMIEEGLVNRIPFEDMPPTQQYNELGQRAHYAIVVGGRSVQAAFEERIRKLRA